MEFQGAVAKVDKYSTGATAPFLYKVSDIYSLMVLNGL